MLSEREIKSIAELLDAKLVKRLRAGIGSDRLPEIKRGVYRAGDDGWLVAEIERLRAENHRLAGGAPILAEKERLNREIHRHVKEKAEIKHKTFLDAAKMAEGEISSDKSGHHVKRMIALRLRRAAEGVKGE